MQGANPCQNCDLKETLMQNVKMKQFLFNLDYRIMYLYRLYILKEHDCDNCSYFGGCMCDHIDENGNCLGWESAGWHPIKAWLYDRKINKMVKKYKKSLAIRKR